MKKLENNLFFSLEQIDKNIYVLRSIYNLNQVNGLYNLLNSNIEFMVNDYELTLFGLSEKKLNKLIDGFTLM